MKTRISSEAAEKWSKCAALWKKSSEALEEIEVILQLGLGIVDGKPVEVLEKAIDAVSGQAYMFTPQPEWIGGDSDDSANTVINSPHIANY